MNLDAIGWYIATMHDFLGHDKAAAAMGVHPGSRADCIICRYDAGQATRDEVAAALSPVCYTSAIGAMIHGPGCTCPDPP